jgi:NarL family two-component system sensor histidine kinase YdfH
MHMPVSSSLRSLLLIWISIVYVWGIEELNQFVLPLCVTSDQSCAFSFTLAAFDLSRTIVFTLLLLLLAAILWFSLSGKLARRVLFICLLLQMGIVFAIYLLAQQEPLTLSLALALALEIITLPRLASTQVLLLSLGSYILLSIGMLAAQRITFGPGMKWLWISILQDIPVYLSQLLFLTGYLFLYRQLDRSHQQLQAASTHIEELTRLTERQRLARDLHDTLAQGLAGMVMQLEVANSHLLKCRVERGQELVQGVLKDARTALSSTRQAIDDLRIEGNTSDKLIARIQGELHRFASTTGIVCQTQLADLAALPPSFAELVSRLIREGLQNIARHAHARQVWVEIRQEQGKYVFLVRDDGRGFDLASTLHAPGHYGLLGLYELAELAGGHFEVRSAPGQGTTLSLRIAMNGGTHGDDREATAYSSS